MATEPAFKPYPAPERELPRTWHGRRPWWRYAGITLVILLWLAGLALVAFIVLFFVALSQFGSNK